MTIKESNIKFRIDINKDKEVPYLFITPFYNAGISWAKCFGERMKILVVRANDAEKKVFELINKGLKVKNLIFNNATIYTKDLIDYCKEHDIRISSHEQGWFPHYSTLHFDPLGFSSRSLLAQSRLDNLDIDIEKVQQQIEKYKNKFCQEKNIFDFKKKYILLIFQYTYDATVVNGYEDFISWQKIVDFAYGLKEREEFLIIKVNPQNVKTIDGIVLPPDSIAIQTKIFNNYLLKNAKAVVGINSTMLYEASLLYDKPVIALGNSWFDCHPEVVQKVNIDNKIEIKMPSQNDLDYRKKMFYIMERMQTPVMDKKVFIRTLNFVKYHVKAASIKKIEEWA